jgi:hypothetical protein
VSGVVASARAVAGRFLELGGRAAPTGACACAMCLTALSSSLRASRGLVLEVRRVGMGVLLVLLVMAMLRLPLTSSGARAGEKVRRVCLFSVADGIRGRTRLAMVLLEKSCVSQGHLSRMAMLSCHRGRAGRGQRRRLGGGQARSGCFCRRVAALGQLHDSFAQCITEAISSLAQHLQNTRARLNINHDILREPAFGYSRRLKWHGAMLAIDQSRACNSAIHATSPDPISGHRSVFKLLSSCAKFQSRSVEICNVLKLCCSKCHYTLASKYICTPKSLDCQDELYIPTHATQRTCKILTQQVKKIIYEKRKSFKTGEPANSGLSRMQLLIVSSINTSDIVR